MLFDIQLPAPPLDRFVESFTYYAGYSADHAIERLLPDGAPHIIVNLDGQPRYTYDNDTLKPCRRFTHSWVSGMHRHMLSISAHVTDASMFVIRLRPGGAMGVFGLPMSELDDEVIDADLIFGAAIGLLREALLEAASARAAFAAAERWFSERYPMPSNSLPVIQSAVERIRRDPTVDGIARIAHASGYSQKHFIHLFKQHVGLTPKVYQRIARFNQVLREIEERRSIAWSQLAYDCGYADQAHFVREFKAFSGLNPSAYLIERGEYLNYVPVR